MISITINSKLKYYCRGLYRIKVSDFNSKDNSHGNLKGLKAYWVHLIQFVKC